MPPVAHTRLILDFDLAANPVTGNVVDGSGRGHPFAGWMALTRTIELTLDAARQANPPRQAQGQHDPTKEHR
jgi:hypothetical protein